MKTVDSDLILNVLFTNPQTRPLVEQAIEQVHRDKRIALLPDEPHELRELTAEIDNLSGHGEPATFPVGKRFILVDDFSIWIDGGDPSLSGCMDGSTHRVAVQKSRACEPATWVEYIRHLGYTSTYGLNGEVLRMIPLTAIQYAMGGPAPAASSSPTGS